jgi:hypothetical protein
MGSRSALQIIEIEGTNRVTILESTKVKKAKRESSHVVENRAVDHLIRRYLVENKGSNIALVGAC